MPNPTVGVGITTHNRPDVLAKTLAAFRKHSPHIPVVVVDDGSTVPVPGAIRHDTPKGIPAAKNRCIAELMKLGVEHLFLFDDDTRPQAADWWRPYVDGPEPHYQYSWLRFTKDNRPVPDMAEVYRDPNLVAYTWSMGCLLYLTRDVVNRVGGMDLRFGRGFEEHVEYSQRIHNCGFTTFVHQDHPGIAEKVWAADEHYAVTRSFARDPERSKRLTHNKALRARLAASTDFIDYQPTAGPGVVLASYFTSQTDLQRNVRLPSNRSALRPLIDSLGDELVILYDNLKDPPPRSEQVHTPLVAYVQRWISQYQWMQRHPEISWVWMVDATDVEALKDPFADMTPDTLYVGDEPSRLSNPWIKQHCPRADLPWLNAHASEPLLNCGIVGGDRETVMQLCRTMIDLWVASDRKDPLYEMLFFNQAARTFPHVVHGRHITTEFKRYEKSNAIAIWKHK